MTGEQRLQVSVRKGNEVIARAQPLETAVTIGRLETCGLRIDDARISREHVRLELREDGQVLVKDLGSRNGVFLDGKRIKKKLLSGNFTLSLGDDYFAVVEPVTPGEQLGPTSPRAEPLPQTYTRTAASTAASTTEGAMVCPHCWYHFGVDQLLAIARHQDLIGDPVLGPETHQRFLPSRFTPEGDALDARGLPCPDAACPRCHLVIPRSLTSKRGIFLSMIGAPASGKSYLLTTMAWELRRLMPAEFGFAFMDADSNSNQIINEYERTLFLAADGDAYVTLEKTEMQGRLYDQVLLDNMTLSLPRPFMFSLAPQRHHPWLEKKKDNLAQTLVLYDNAGEHFEPGMDSAMNPGTQHLARANGIFFLFDPTKDPRFRAVCHSDDPQLRVGQRVERQEILLTEAIGRVQRYAPQWRGKRYERPLVIVVTKFDIWRELLKNDIGRPWLKVNKHPVAMLDMDCVMAASFELRHLLKKLCPELVSSAESLASRVTYIPVSALGCSPTIDPNRSGSGSLVVQPKNVRPTWAPVPLLYMLSLLGLMPGLRRRPDGERFSKPVGRRVGDDIVVTLPDRHGPPIEVPVFYEGRLLRCPETGQWFRVPTLQELPDAGGVQTRAQL